MSNFNSPKIKFLIIISNRPAPSMSLSHFYYITPFFQLFMLKTVPQITEITNRSTEINTSVF